MNTGIMAGIAMGVALSYFLDPDRGRKRRATARDSGMHLARQGMKMAASRFRGTTNRMRGRLAEMRARSVVEEVDDWVAGGPGAVQARPFRPAPEWDRGGGAKGTGDADRMGASGGTGRDPERSNAGTGCALRHRSRSARFTGLARSGQVLAGPDRR